MMQIQTLADCEQHQTCQIESLTGDLDTKLHLVNLGFHTNSHIKLFMVRSNNFIISVDGSRFAINRDVANHIRVRPLS